VSDNCIVLSLIFTGVTRLIPFLERETYSSIRFQFIRVENNNYLEATQQIKQLKECMDVQEDCPQFSRILVDMNPKDTHSFLLAVRKKSICNKIFRFLGTSNGIY
jgi:hypothetical protein